MNRVRLLFELEEEVTPQLFALRVASACAKYYALRPGESVVSGRVRFSVKVAGIMGQSVIQTEVR